ncbi:MAG: hypothetical protein ACHQRM_17990, partial [Bacteroidia bacterium]
DEVHIYGQQYIRYAKPSFRNRIASLSESILYSRGIRKLPLSVQNTIMQGLLHKNMYPSASDFSLTDKREEMLACKTFFGICIKK